MPLCTFSENYLMLGVTPVENLFIQEFLPRASGDYVRVYLYGLMQCYHPSEDMTLERTAHILDLPPETVRDAFQYWERQGLVQRVSDKPVSYQYLNLAATMSGESPMDRAIYRHRDFNNRLQQLFGNRLLHPAEFMTACEWIEDLHLPEAVVLILVESYISLHGSKFQFKKLDKLAVQWAEEGVVTEALAQERVLLETEAGKLAERVLKRLSIFRRPTRDEALTAKKWLEEWKLTPNAVMAACTETLNGRNPSIGYLDGILRRNVSVISGADMASHLEESHRIDDAIKQLHDELGLRNVSPMAGEQEKYRKYLAAGFDPETILRVAKEVASTLRAPDMQRLDEALTGFMERGQLTLEAVESHLEQQKSLREQVSQVYKACNLVKKITAADAAQLQDWLKLASFEVVMYAAECARGKALPTGYITKLLTDWKKLDLTTVELAKKHYETGKPAAAQTGARQTPTPNALNFQQRTYQEGELDYLFDKMNKYDTEEDDNDAK